MKQFLDIELFDRGDGYRTVRKGGHGIPNILDFIWMKHDHWYFI